MAGAQTTDRVTVKRRGNPIHFNIHRSSDPQEHEGKTAQQYILGAHDGQMSHTGGMDRKPRKVGYARVSSDEQDTALQLAALRGAGCDLIFEEKKSSVGVERHALNACLAQLESGDSLVVWKLDRLGRTTVQLLNLVEQMEREGIHFICTTQGFDTSTPMGKLMLTVLAGFAEFERGVIIERTRAGLAEAHQKGHFGGGRRKLRGETLQRAIDAYHNRPINPATGKRYTNIELAEQFGVTKHTLQRWALHDGKPTWAPQRAAFDERNPDLDAWRQRTEDPLFGRNLTKR